MAKIAIKDKTHLGSGTYDVLAQFKFTNAVDSLGDRQADGTGWDPHVHVFTYRVSIDLATATTKAARKAAILAALKPVAAQYKAQTVTARTQAEAAAAANADLNVDTDDGSDVGVL